MTRLTREMLEGYGVKSVSEDGKRIYTKTGLKKIIKLVRHHKYAPDKVYYGVMLVDKSVKIPKKAKYYRKKTKDYGYYDSWIYKPITITLGRLMIAWFKGSIEADEDADHIDNNPANNHIDNLQVLSRKDNLMKRYIDNPDNYHNQYGYLG